MVRGPAVHAPRIATLTGAVIPPTADHGTDAEWVVRPSGRPAASRPQEYRTLGHVTASRFMESVRDHMDHHDDPAELSLVTESARVDGVTGLDHNRTEELRRAAARYLDELGRGEFVEETAPPRLDWEGATAFLEGADDGPLEEKLGYLTERYDRAYPSLLSLQLSEEDEALDFVPGQYVTIRFHDTPRPYSVASSPNRNHLAFCLRRVPGGRLTADLFEQLEPGDEVAIRGPNGDFVMEDSSSRDLAFLATGTGVAPLKSMIDYTFEENRDVSGGRKRDVWLFLGCSWKDDLPYRSEFRTLASDHENFHFVPTLSREEYLTDWAGETAHVQQAFLKYLADDVETDVSPDLTGYLDEAPNSDIEARITPGRLEVYACGVSAMVETLVDTAESAGVPAEHIHGEGYG